MSAVAAGLTRAAIVDAAFEVLEDAGIDGLTLRAVAARLGVRAPAIYWHLDSKQALLDEMGTAIERRIVMSLIGLPEDIAVADALRAYAVSMRTEYLRHRDGARTFSGTRLTDPEVLRLQEAALTHWTSSGIALATILDAFEIITAYVVGFVIEEQERADAERYQLAQRDEFVGPDHPLVVESGQYLYRPAAERFAAQLDVLVPALAAAATPT
jgi:AcrR family transcriptional regulator